MKLNYREKIILLVFVLIMTIFVGVMVLIKPQISQMKANNQLLSEKQDQKEEITQKIASIKSLGNNEGNLQSELQIISDFFFPEITNDLVDKYIYEIAKENDITIDSMVLQETNTQEISFYDPLLTDETTKVKVNADCATAVITFNVTSQENFEVLLDALDKQEKAVLVKACSLTANEDSGSYLATVEVWIYSAKSYETIISEDSVASK